MARHPKEHYKMNKNERHKIHEKMEHEGHHVAHHGHMERHEKYHPMHHSHHDPKMHRSHHGEHHEDGMRHGGGSPSMGHRGHVPTTISDDPRKHANLPTDPVFMNYPYLDYVDQYVGDSIVEADRTQDMGVRELRRQNAREKY